MAISSFNNENFSGNKKWYPNQGRFKVVLLNLVLVCGVAAAVVMGMALLLFMPDRFLISFLFQISSRVERGLSRQLSNSVIQRKQEKL